MTFPSLNDRDALLEAAPFRVVNTGQIKVVITPSIPAFHLNSANVPDVGTIDLTATLIGAVGPVTWGAQNATITGISGTNNVSAQLRFIDVTGPFATVTASITVAGVTYSTPLTLSIVKDGQNGTSVGAKVVTLTPSAQVFKISKAGVNDIASITLDATGQNTTGTPNFTILAGSATLAAGASASQKILTYANMTSDSVTVKITLDGQTDQVTIIKVREGLDGASATNGLLSNEAVTLPADASGNVTSLADAVCTLSIYQGITNDSGSWTYGFAPVSSASGLAYTTSTNALTVTGLAAGVDAAYVDITATRTGYASVTKRFSVSKSRQGAQGSGTAGARGAGQYYAIGSSWSDVVADIATPGTGNIIGDQVTIADGTVTYTKRWDGSAWNVPGAYLSGSLFVPESINAAAINANGLSIRDTAGNIILNAGQSLAQQTKSAPNLVPRLSASNWVKSGNPVTWIYRDDQGRPGNGEILIFDAGTGYIGVDGPDLPLIGGEWYTVSFMASGAAGSLLNTDVYGSNGVGGIVDSPGLIGIPMSPNGTRYTYTEQLPMQAGAVHVRFWRGNTTGQMGIWDVKVGRGKTDTPYSEDIITSGNASQFVMPGAIGNTQIGGDLYSTNWNGLTGVSGQGWLMRRDGFLFAYSVSLRGSLMGGAFTEFNWPAAGTTGYYLSSDGLLLGNWRDGRWFQVYANGNVFAPGFEITNGQVTVTSPIIVNPSISGAVVDTFSVSIPGGQLYGTGPKLNARAFGTRTVSVTGNFRAPLAYQWLMSSSNSANGRTYDVFLTGDSASATIGSGGTTYNQDDEITAIITCIVTDANGVSKSAQVGVRQIFGSGAL